MMIARILGESDGREDQGLGPVLGLLAFLWVVALVLGLSSIAVGFAADGSGSGATARIFDDLLPSDHLLWSGFAA